MTDLSSLPDLASLPQPLIRLDAVSKSFATRAGRFDAVRNVSLSIRAGDTFGIIGKSGAGKSTLLRLINLLERPDEGTVRVGGTELTALGKPALRAARQNIGMIFQQFNLLQNETVFENVAFPLRVHGGRGREQIAARVRECLEIVGLTDKTASHPAQLSGGQKQRVAIARALAMQPLALLCDEITSALDPELVNEVLAVVRELAADGMTLLMVTHEMRFAREVCDRVVFMHQGRVHEIGPPEELFTAPTTPELRQFLGMTDLAG